MSIFGNLRFLHRENTGSAALMLFSHSLTGTTLLDLAGVVSVLLTDIYVCVFVCASVILTRVVLARWLAPSQTDSSTSASSASLLRCWLRR